MCASMGTVTWYLDVTTCASMGSYIYQGIQWFSSLIYKVCKFYSQLLMARYVCSIQPSTFGEVYSIQVM